MLRVGLQEARRPQRKSPGKAQAPGNSQKGRNTRSRRNVKEAGEHIRRREDTTVSVKYEPASDDRDDSEDEMVDELVESEVH